MIVSIVILSPFLRFVKSLLPLSILPAFSRAGSSPGRAQRVQDAPCAAAGALDHGHRPRIRPAMLPPIRAGAPAAGTCCRSDQSPGAGPGRPQPSRRVLPILPAFARAGSRQDVRSTARTPGAQLPEPRITGTRPRITGHAAADPRRSPAAGTRCRLDQRAQEGPQPSRRVLPILPAPARAGSSPGRAQRVQDAPPGTAGALDHGHRPRIRPATLPPCLQNEIIGKCPLSFCKHSLSESPRHFTARSAESVIVGYTL